MTILHIDFETRSTVDLKNVGLDNYARRPTTDVWCMAYAFDDEDVELWMPGEPILQRVVEHVQDGGLVYAHNAAFEWAIWNHILVPRYGFPGLDIRQCRCTMAMAYAMALPGSLGQAAMAVGLEQNKDMDGHRLMLQMARPRRINPDGTPAWWGDEDRKGRLYAYCKQDVATERTLHKRLRELSPTEQEVWLLDHEINTRGIPVDLPSIEKAIATVETEQARLNAELHRLTNGDVASCSAVLQLTEWCKAQGFPVVSLAKADVASALEHPGIPPSVRKALLLRQEFAKSSTAKLVAMREGASEGRVRGAFQYHGASTGRWAGRKIQPQNFPRPNISQREIEEAIEIIDDPDLLRILYGNPMDIISWSLRGMIAAPDDRELIAADFSNIEGRVLAWLAGERWKLQAFRDFDSGTGHDLYKITAGSILGKKPEAITKGERQAYGKVPELALGYQGGVGAFQQMAVAYGVQLDDEQADQIKVAWRERHPAIVQFWYALEEAAVNAVRNPRRPFAARSIKFIKDGSFLWAVLPSRRALCYPYPRIDSIETPWGDMKQGLVYLGIDTYTRKWGDVKTYGGKLAENVTQAVARDVLRDAMLRVKKAGGEIVLHVHDELAIEADKGKISLDQFEALMAQVPTWAKGLPVSVEGWKGRRYRK